MADYRIRTNDRIFVTGKTGSGKTFLMQHVTKRVRRLAVLDGKGTLGGWNLEPYGQAGLSKLRQGEDVRLRVIYTPGEDVETYWLTILEALYSVGNLTIYIDELYVVNGGPSTRPSPIMNALYTLGRELGIGVWATTQRPSWVPLVHMSEADHFFIFRLNMPEDRQRMAEVTGVTNVLEPIRDPYGFFYMIPEWDEADYREKLRVKELHIEQDLEVAL
jgi:hypothetical protein